MKIEDAIDLSVFSIPKTGEMFSVPIVVVIVFY